MKRLFSFPSQSIIYKAFSTPHPPENKEETKQILTQSLIPPFIAAEITT